MLCCTPFTGKVTPGQVIARDTGTDDTWPVSSSVAPQLSSVTVSHVWHLLTFANGDWPEASRANTAARLILRQRILWQFCGSLTLKTVLKPVCRQS